MKAMKMVRIDKLVKNILDIFNEQDKVFGSKLIFKCLKVLKLLAILTIHLKMALFHF